MINPPATRNSGVQVQLEIDANRLDKEAHRLVGAIAKIGLTTELEAGIQERQASIRQVQTELAQVEMALKQQGLEISNEALAHLAREMRELLQSGNTEHVRRILHQALARVVLQKEKLTLHYYPPILQSQLIPGFKIVPPWEFESQSWP